MAFESIHFSDFLFFEPQKEKQQNIIPFLFRQFHQCRGQVLISNRDSISSDMKMRLKKKLHSRKNRQKTLTDLLAR
jgi:hypothetical protein